MSDVTTCFNSLKRVVQEFRSITALEGELQMAQPSVKPAAVTLRADPNAAFSMDFDNMVASWDEYLNLGGKNDAENDSDDDYNPKAKKVKGKASVVPLPSATEAVRANAHTLLENHEFLLANSFDASFGGSGANLSSSQNGCFGFDDTFDGLDIGEGIGADLVRELGEGWGASPTKDKAASNVALAEDFDLDFDYGGDLNHEMQGFGGVAQDISQPATPIQGLYFEPVVGPPPSSPLVGTAQSHKSASTNPMSPQAEPAAQQANDQQVVGGDDANPPRKAKRARLLLDARTELTDEELKAARMHYLDEQNAIRRDLEIKRFEREHPGLIHNLLWDAPGSMQAKELVDFWVDHFKAHVEARSTLFMEPQDELPRSKRRKMKTDAPNPHAKEIEEVSQTYAVNDWHGDEAAGVPVDGGGMEIDFNYEADVGIWGGAGDYTQDARNFRSSEEPGQARRASRPPSAFGDNLDIGVVADAVISQRSALFPWDMAGNSSSLVDHGGGIRLGSSDRMSVEPADTRLRGSSLSRRASSFPSAPGSLQPGIGSPVAVPRGSQIVDDFAFDVPGNDSLLDSQQSEANLAALEKNSFNFLEYAKMQYMSLSGASQYLAFDDVVPKATSTAHVAAAALYHCLVLGTKDLLRLKQEDPYGRIDIRIK
ncbi:hypothetical protein BDN67DRAFT_39579 [Paxillus ammoniavirescens]|nr:hypothetical protein BDN67DRAFT_39579 [Paxillus ammoniavirescens]